MKYEMNFLWKVIFTGCLLGVVIVCVLMIFRRMTATELKEVEAHFSKRKWRIEDLNSKDVMAEVDRLLRSPAFQCRERTVNEYGQTISLRKYPAIERLFGKYIEIKSIKGPLFLNLGPEQELPDIGKALNVGSNGEDVFLYVKPDSNMVFEVSESDTEDIEEYKSIYHLILMDAEEDFPV